MQNKFFKHIQTGFTSIEALIITTLLFTSMFLMFYRFYMPASIQIEFQAESDSIFQVYWAAPNKTYSEKQSSLILFNTGSKSCQLALPNLKNIAKLRIDPLMKPSKLILKKIVINQLGYKPIQFETRAGLNKIKPLHQIREYELNNNGLAIVSSGIDPQLEIDVKPILKNRLLSYVIYLIGAFISLLLTLTISPFVYKFVKSMRQSIPLYFTRIFPSPKIRMYSAIIAVIGSALLIIVIPIQLPPSYTFVYLVLNLAGIGIPIFLLSYWLLSRPVYRYQVIKVSSWSWLWYAAPCYLIWTIYLLAFWPGQMSPDSLSQWKDAMTGNFRDWHPAFHSMTLWLITRFWDSPPAVAFTQIFFLGLTVAWGLVILRKLGVPKFLNFIVCLFFALTLVNGLMVIALWKDVAYSIAVLAMTLIVLQIVSSDGKWILERRSWIFFGVIIVLTAIYRHNGVSTALGTPLILIVIYRKFWKQLTFALVLGMFLYIGIRGPLYGILDINRNLPNPNFQPKVAKYEKRRLGATVTTPTSTTSENQSIFRNTIKVFRYYADLSSTIWRVKPLEGRFKRVEYTNVWWDHKKGIRYINSNKLDINEDSLAPRIRNFIFNKFIQSVSQPQSYFIWRPAFYLYLFLASVVIVSIRLNSWKFLLLSVPIVLHLLPFFLISTSKAVFRYHYSVVIVSLLLSLPLFFLNTVKNNKKCQTDY